MFSGLFLVPFLPVSLVSLGTDPLLSNSSPFSTACMNLSKPQSDVIYLDFRKAFDSVSHNELLFKLRCLGIRGNLWCWFKAYLSDRMQCVAINGHTSGLLPVLSGVPQGSILGPLLFLLFINDLPQSVRLSSMLLFADDAKCFRPITDPSDCSLLQDDLVRLLDWSNKWKLHFNISKCALVRFSYGTPISPASSYCMGDQDIVALDCLRYLGVLISDDLSWSAHYDLLCSRAYKILGLLRRVFNNVFAIAAKKHLYISLVCSQLTYCSVVWRPHLTDILLFIKSLKYPSESFNILDFVSFCSGPSRSAAHLKLQLSPANRSTNRIRHFYFSRLPRLWNYLPTINLEKSVMSIKSDITAFFWSRFQQTFDPSRPCTYHAVCPCTRCSSLSLPNNFNLAVSTY